jgi:polar amino acid transport system substrate-binding protein
MGVTRTLALLLFWAWAAVVPSAAQSSSPLLTVYFSERPPFTIVDGQRGILLDLTKVVLTAAGVRARFIELPPDRILELLRSGQPNALGVGWFRTPEREQWGRFSVPLYQDRPLVALINARAAATLANPVRLEALLGSGLTLGLQSGASLGAVLDRRIRALGLVPLETMVDVDQLVKMVWAGRMDYTLMSEDEALYQFDHDTTLSGGVVLTHLSEPLSGNQRHFLYSASFDPSLAARIDSAIEKVKASPRYQQLISLN